jgi:pectate lyase
MNYYLLAATNKWLLIYESHDDSNRCTPCRGKYDQRDMYFSHASPRTPDVRFLRAVHVHGNHSHSHQQCRTDPTAPENQCSRCNPQPN